MKTLNDRYANARILEVDYDDGMVEVEIRHDKKDKEVLFTKSCEWISTSWDVARRNVPDVVLKALQQKYPNGLIDDIDFIEMPQGSYYRFEIELRGQQDEYVYITPQGVITEVRVYHR
ncbi:PepSY-like domain-containing protein [uncultured Porphyromonas sp.]|uniref:PepSY-like domain-containing protein n=1 Tax=uncultured Porphyromonas sp. TaxID=159274 RepID=UPI002804635A|nr:PepSY-like domain-containing protein [uncultured Porphyromonas sp.]